MLVHLYTYSNTVCQINIIYLFDTYFMACSIWNLLINITAPPMGRRSFWWRVNRPVECATSSRCFCHWVARHCPTGGGRRYHCGVGAGWGAQWVSWYLSCAPSSIRVTPCPCFSRRFCCRTFQRSTVPLQLCAKRTGLPRSRCACRRRQSHYYIVRISV